MMLCFVLIGCAVVGMAVIPTYATIGVAAPILAVIARMVQGFSLGGEIGSTTAYLMESAPAHRRGFNVSWQSASQNMALIAGGMALTSSLTHGHFFKSQHAPPAKNIPPDMVVVVSSGAKLFHVPGCEFIHDKASERTLTAKGHLGATLHDTTVDGRFGIPPSTGARTVTLQVRPIADRGCTALDFRWQFQG